jgi:ribulokinase
MLRKAGLIGVDVGTEGLRAALFDLDGAVLASAQYLYATASPIPARFEQDPADWWSGLKMAVAQCLAESQFPRDAVLGIGFTGTSCTVVPVDAMGTPLRPAILWMDTRAHLEADDINALHHPAIMCRSGHVSAEWMLPKALWLQRHEPEIWERTHKLVEGPDFLTWKLTGCWTVATGSAVGKRNWVRALGGWPDTLYRAAGIPEFAARNPERVLFPGQPAGVLSPEGAEALGLLPGIIVANAGPDAYVGMAGLNVMSSREMALVVGSSNVHLLPLEKETRIPGMWGPWSDIMLPDRWLLEGGQLATGLILRWFAGQFAASAAVEAQRRGVSVYRVLDEQAAAIEPGSGGLVVLDYWLGNRTPYNDALATGAVWGLTLSHTPAHLYRALLEGTAYGTAHTLLEFRRAGLTPEVMIACGGGARSELWLQIYADACGIPVQTTHFADATALGSAVCAAVAAGCYADLPEAAGRMVRVTRTLDPRPIMTRLYEQYLEQYIGTYEALRDRMHAVGRIPQVRR